MENFSSSKNKLPNVSFTFMPRNRGEIVEYKNFTHNVILGRMKSVLRNISLHGIGEVSGQGPGQLKLKSSPFHPLKLNSHSSAKE